LFPESAQVRTAVFVPSQLLNCALALTSLAPGVAAPALAWLPLACSAVVMVALAVAAPAAVLRTREAELRREFLAAARA
jgi:hypothetical protein